MNYFSFLDNKRSKLWLHIFQVLIGIGGITTIGAAIFLPKAEEISTTTVNVDTPYDVYQNGCSAKESFEITDKSAKKGLANFISDGKIVANKRILSTKWCSYLNETHRDLMKFEPGGAVTGGTVEETTFGVARNWPIDLLRRFGVLLLGMLLTFLVSLPTLYQYHSLVTLEEIRDLSKN